MAAARPRTNVRLHHSGLQKQPFRPPTKCTGEITTVEMERILEYLGINLVQASLALVCLRDVEEYFEPTCETAAMLARALVISLTRHMSMLGGNFETLKTALCTAIAERQVLDLIEHQRRLRELQMRGFSAEG